MDSSASPRCMGHQFSIIHYFTALFLVPWLRVMTVLRSDRNLILSSPCDGVNHTHSPASFWNHGNGQNSFTWSECVTLWVCTLLQSLCPTEDEQSLFPCNWSFHLLPWYSHMTEQMFNYLWLGQQLRRHCPVCCPPGHCGHLERISPACMRSWKLLCRTASLSLCPHALCLLVDEWMEIWNSKTEFPCLVNGICLSNKLPWL